MGALLTREAILAASDLRTEDVPMPEWGGDVRLRVLTGTERDAFGKSLIGADGKADMSGYEAKLLALCIVDEAGNRVFSSIDVTALAGKSAPALRRAYEVAERLNAMGSAAVDTAEKNSASAPSSASTSDLPAT